MIYVVLCSNKMSQYVYVDASWQGMGIRVDRVRLSPSLCFNYVLHRVSASRSVPREAVVLPAMDMSTTRRSDVPSRAGIAWVGRPARVGRMSGFRPEGATAYASHSRHCRLSALLDFSPSVSAFRRVSLTEAMVGQGCCTAVSQDDMRKPSWQQERQVIHINTPKGGAMIGQSGRAKGKRTDLLICSLVASSASNVMACRVYPAHRMKVIWRPSGVFVQ